MLTALARAFAQLSDPAVRRVLWFSIGAAILGFLLLSAGVWVVLFKTQLSGLAWLDTLVDVLGGLAVVVLPYFLFPGVAGAVAGLLLDDVVHAVERRYYPALAPARDQPVSETVVEALRFLAVVIGLNLLALPFYLFLPAINLFLYYGLNGFLLGREYFDLVALRRMRPREARAARRRYGLRLFLAGVIIAFLLTIPVVNLLVPVVASAFMVHIYHGFRESVAEAETL